MIKDVFKWLTLADNGEKPSIETIETWLTEELDEFKEAILISDQKAAQNAVIDSIWILLNFAYFNNLNVENLEKEAKAVFKSNMSKYCKTAKEAQKTCHLYSIGKHPNKPGIKIETYFTKVEKYYIIRRKIDGKILKSYKFQDC